MEDSRDVTMQIDFNSIVSTVDALPPLSDAAQQIQRIYADSEEDIDILSLTRAIEADASLSANILKMVNAPFYGFSKQITSVSQAVTLFGTQMIYAIVMKYAISQVVVANLRPYGISASRLNVISHLQSRLAKQWYAHVNLQQSADLASIALVMESGKLVVSKEIVSQGQIKEFQKGLVKSNTILEHEYATFKSSSYYVAGLLFEHWNLDPLYAATLKGIDFDYDYDHPYYLNYVEALDIIRTAINIKEVLTSSSITAACTIVEESNMVVEDFLHVIKQIKKSLKAK